MKKKINREYILDTSNVKLILALDGPIGAGIGAIVGIVGALITANELKNSKNLKK